MIELDSLLKLDYVQLDTRIGSGETPLSLAVKRENEDAVRLLIHTGRISVNLRNEKGQLPLSLALQRSNKAIIELLLKTRQVDLYAVDLTPPGGKTPLDYAVEAIARKHDRKYPKIVKHVSGGFFDSDFQRFEERAEYSGRYGISKLFREYRRTVPSQKPRAWRHIPFTTSGYRSFGSSPRR